MIRRYVGTLRFGWLPDQPRGVTNFDARLPVPQSDLARESLKDPYRFDFLGLGAGFAFVGRQVLLDVGGDDEFFIDLLFYHLKLRCYVVIELEGGKFRPEHVGQLGFYLTAVDRQVEAGHDNPTSACCCARARTRWWPSTRWATRPSRWALPNSSCSNRCPPNGEPNALGMRVMQEQADAKRGEPYLLIKSPPASGNSRALLFIALDKLHNQGRPAAGHRGGAGALHRRQLRRRAAEPLSR